ncbi:hypothetical protein L1987_11505 [Smallanthus sonchifolius]|uniref:Uncharacterized protein n=1 Tax=Smallanthus sonchifolius TaxID=185202 RepID=A0ACB9JEL1_9ASTR|nr:hypothetical protein L1987_11505 [Smallanthus sonchifolius]
MLLPYINIFFLVLRTARSINTISVHQNISDGETIVSENAEFELGFFSPGSSKSRYLGIWFKKTSPQTVVWVANQETPLKDTLGAVKLDNKGNLTLVGGSGKVIWSSNTSASGTNINLVAQLLDTGNLVIKNGNDVFIWQIFYYPGDTYVPGMKLGKNIITGRDSYLTSWRSADDPSPGEYSFRFLMVKGKYPQVCIMRSSEIETRIGSYNGITFSGLANYAPDTNWSYIHYMTVNQDEIYTSCISISKSNTTTLRAIVTPGGKLEPLHLKISIPEWMLGVTLPADYCDIYGVCGPYGSFNTATSPYCGCLKGFERKNSDNDTSVCQQRIALDCGPGEGFLKFLSITLPDTDNAVFSSNMSLIDCEVACKNNCSCTAYANPNITSGGVGCLLWFGGLIDVRVYPQNGQGLYVRITASELSGLHSSFHKKKRLVMVVTLSISAVLTLSGLILAFYIRRKWKKTSNAESRRQMESAEKPDTGSIEEAELSLRESGSINYEIVLSSSAIVYGWPKEVTCTEDFRLSAANPYGRTKEGAKATTETVDALRTGAQTLNAIQKAMDFDDVDKKRNFDEVDKNMDEINEQTENMKQIQEALSAPHEAELEDLEGSELEEHLLQPTTTAQAGRRLFMLENNPHIHLNARIHLMKMNLRHCRRKWHYKLFQFHLGRDCKDCRAFNHPPWYT